MRLMPGTQRAKQLILWRLKAAFMRLGVTVVALERRSPEYLAKFVVDEIVRWAGPIKANGLQVD
jgi:hypothetical protein